MEYNGTQIPTVKIIGQFDHHSGLTMERMEVVSDTEHFEMTFKWPSAARGSVRGDLFDVIDALVRERYYAAMEGGSYVNAPNFLVQIPGLRLEDLKLLLPSSGTVEISMRLTRGKIASLFFAPPVQRHEVVTEDVVLPLTNLMAYLRAMGAQSERPALADAMDIAADRIEEFLLIYGNRLTTNPPLPTQSVALRDAM